jgi:hypothetical protein
MYFFMFWAYNVTLSSFVSCILFLIHPFILPSFHFIKPSTTIHFPFRISTAMQKYSFLHVDVNAFLIPERNLQEIKTYLKNSS